MIKDYKEVITALSSFILNEVKDAGCESCIVGLSGGIDSAVVARLCIETNLKTILINMPVSEKDTVFTERAQKLSLSFMKKFENVKCYYNPIDDIFDSYISSIQRFSDFNLKDDLINQGNLRSRIRANILYGFAREFDGLVIGTGNLAEDFCLGYFTKYGDGAVDISPIGDLYKSEVYELGKFFELSEEILKAKPSAGLWDGQTDEGELGFSYDMVEDWHRGKPIPIDVKNKIEAMNKRNSHKMRMPNICKVREKKEIIE